MTAMSLSIAFIQLIYRFMCSPYNINEVNIFYNFDKFSGL